MTNSASCGLVDQYGNPLTGRGPSVAVHDLTTKTAEAAAELRHHLGALGKRRDYHTHIIESWVETNEQFGNPWEFLFEGDHYVMRLMRLHKIDEKYITGSATPKQKWDKLMSVFYKWGKNPVALWIRMALENLGVEASIMDYSNPDALWNEINERLSEASFKPHGLLDHVELFATTNMPMDDLQYHKRFAESGPEGLTMIPTLRLDGSWRWSDATTGEPQQAEWRSYIEQLGQAAETPITDLATLFEAFEKISDFFADHGCVSMDLGLDESELRLEQERAGLDASAIFTRLIGGQTPDQQEAAVLRNAIIKHLASICHDKDWVMQLHGGPYRNMNQKMRKTAGKDIGFDGMSTRQDLSGIRSLLHQCAADGALPKTVIYTADETKTTEITQMVAAHPDFVYINDLWWQKDRLASMTTSIETIDELTTLTGGGVFWITDTRSLPTNLSRFQMWDSAVCAFLGSCVAREYHNMDSAKAVLEDVSINNAKNVYGEPKFNLGVN